MTPMLFLVAFLIGLDEFLLGPLLTPIGAEFGVAPEQVALMVAAYNLPLAILAPFLGTLSDRIGRTRVLRPALLTFAAASLLTAAAPSFALAVGARVLTGIAAAGMLPVAFALASETEDAAKAISRVQAGLTLGIILGPLNGALMEAAGNWRLSFVALGLVAVVLVLAVRGFSKATRSLASDEQAPTSAIVPAVPGLAAMLFGLGGAIGIFAILGERVRDVFSLETWQVSLLFASFGLMTVAGNLLAPWFDRHLGARMAAGLNLVFVLAGIVVLFASVSPGVLLAAISLMAWSVFGGATAPALQTALAEISSAHRGLVLALGSSCLNLGVALSSALTSALHLHAPHLVAAQATATILPAALVMVLWAMRGRTLRRSAGAIR
jgi:predicted MFS family arabinose efflux permease